MLVSRIVDTAIVLVAIYFGLSVVVSHINEQIAALLQWRGAKLYSGILNLLSGSLELTQALFQHPLIAATQCDANGKINPEEKYRPSYLSARDFSLALWQSVGTATATRVAADGTPSEQGTAVKYAFDAAAAGPSLAMDALESKVALLPSHLRISLNALLSQAAGDYQRLLQATDAWFNRQMDRVSGWYRRQSQFAVIVISVLLVVLLGVDTIRITTRLYADDNIRHVIAPKVASTIGTTTQGTLPTAAQEQNLLAALDDPSFVGSFASGPVFLPYNWSNPWAGLMHLFGVFLTIVAISLGAPFWFDALQFFSNIRLAGPKPSTATGSSVTPASQPQGP